MSSRMSCRRTDPRLVLIALLATAAASLAPAAAAPPSRFEFVVLTVPSHAGQPGAPSALARGDSLGVLFTLEDIESWSHAGSRIRLKPLAAERLEEFPWWQRLRMRAGGGRFEFRVDGVPVCGGLLVSFASSSLPPPGLQINVQTFIFGDHRTLSFGYYGGSDRDNQVHEPQPPCRDDPRLIAVMREAGVLTE